MSSSNFIRWGAIATMLAGALSILIGVLSAIEENNYSVVESTRWVVLVVGLVGLYLYLRRSRRFGRVGAVGFYILIVACVLNAIGYMGLLLHEGEVWMQLINIFAAVGALLGLFGQVLFGICILRAGNLPRAGAWLWLVSAPIFVGAIVGFIVGGPWSSWSFVVGEVVFGLGCIVLVHLQDRLCGMSYGSRHETSNLRTFVVARGARGFGSRAALQRRLCSAPKPDTSG